MFSQTFLQFLILLALGWTAAGAVALIVLLVRDYLQGKLW